MNIRKNTKWYLCLILRNLCKILYVFPIKQNRIIFCANQGKAYSCNPKYIYEYIQKNYTGEYECIWVTNKQEFQNVKTVEINTLKYLYYMLTAKMYIGNSGIISYIPKRKGQIVVNTWHGGGAYKKVLLDIKNNESDKKIIHLIGKETDLFVSSCHMFTEIMSRAYNVKKENFIEYGMPRNDVFFSENKIKLIKEKMQRKLGINKEERTILYAPTFRDTGRNVSNNLDILRVQKALVERFGGEWKILIRKHYANREIQEINRENCFDVGHIQDMQELLVLADVLITDYSSSMWDFSLTKKPCFIFAPDFEVYSQERDFYVSMDRWPFPVAYSNDELIRNISMFSEEKYAQEIERHHTELGCAEEGKATKKVVEKLIEYLKMGK